MMVLTPGRSGASWEKRMADSCSGTTGERQAVEEK